MRGFVLGIFLLALVGWCMVHETLVQTRARYDLADAARKEVEIVRRLEKLRAREESLKRHARLAVLAKELKLETVNLTALPKETPAGRNGPAAKNGKRRPGDYYDAGFDAGETGPDSVLAQAGSR